MKDPHDRNSERAPEGHRLRRASSFVVVAVIAAMAVPVWHALRTASAPRTPPAPVAVDRSVTVDRAVIVDRAATASGGPLPVGLVPSRESATRSAPDSQERDTTVPSHSVDHFVRGAAIPAQERAGESLSGEPLEPPVIRVEAGFADGERPVADVLVPPVLELFGEFAKGETPSDDVLVPPVIDASELDLDSLGIDWELVPPR